MGLTWVSVFLCWLVTHTDRQTHAHKHTHTHTHADISFRSAYHPHVGKKICSCYRSFLSARYKRETPVCPRPLGALNGPANASSVQPIQRQHQEATYQICENCHTLLAIFSSADACSPSLCIQWMLHCISVSHSMLLPGVSKSNFTNM